MIKGIGHIGICVTDLEAALNGLCTAFELEKPPIQDDPEQGVKMAWVPMGAVSLELVEDYGGQSILAGDIEQKGDHIHHFCLLSDDIEHDFDALKKKGVEMQSLRPRIGLRGKKIAFIAPGVLSGIPIEISEQ